MPVDAGGLGLSYGQVSAYVPVQSFVPYNVGIVPGGSSVCDSSAFIKQTSVPALTGGGAATVAFVGERQGMSTWDAIAVVDDQTVPLSDGGSAKVHLRVLHAAPGAGPIDIWQGSTLAKGKFLFKNVAFGKTSTPPGNPDAGLTVDMNGYLSTGALASAELWAIPSGVDGGATLAKGNLSSAAGATITVALVGDTPPDEDAGTGSPFAFLACVDNAPGVTVLGTCSILPPQQQ
jgi:hypothetical protein